MVGNNYVNLFYLTYDAFNAIKKKYPVYYIEKMKGKVVLVKQIQNSCSEIENLSENVKGLANTNGRLTNELMVVKKCKQHFKKQNNYFGKTVSKR